MNSRLKRGLAAGLLLAAPFLAASELAAQHLRDVSGVVTDKRGNALNGAAVQIENTGDLAIASYLTQNNGKYYFHNLNPDIDYTLKAKYKRWWSKERRLSKFDEKKTATIDLEVPVE